MARAGVAPTGLFASQLVSARPAVCAVIGMILAVSVTSHPWNIVLLVLPLLFAMPLRAWAYIAAGFLIGALRAPYHSAPLPVGNPFSGSVVIWSTPHTTALGESAIGESQGKRYWVLAPQGAHLVRSATYRVAGNLVDLSTKVAAYARSFGCDSTLRVQYITMVAPATPFQRSANKLNAQVTMALAKDPWSLALVSGDLSGVGDAGKTELQQSGVFHLAAASGLQVLLLAELGYLLLSWIPVPRAALVTLVFFALLFYAGTTGMHIATLRAALMWLIGSMAFFFNRQRDAMSALAVTAIVLILWRPEEVFDPGFQLTLLTIAGLIVGAESWPIPFEKTWWGNGLGAAFSGWIFSTPFVAYQFGLVTFLGLPLSVLLGGVASIAVTGAFLGFLMLPISGLMGHLFLGGSVWLSGFLGGVIQAASGLSAWGFVVGSFSGYWLVGIYVVLFGLWRWRERKAVTP